ncbi:LytTR family DNA-binding domain-containing protein [uncultured Sphingomonas sp.]|uniref:LytTR family DNA-binding domain-containing protein n=1 Tax=uncultured Sphingomonas sp. TaxID=158754 RepID=UPI0025E0C487|nr:LytTR family DNA-binding domain-containing protein [uncultured Sphingomonas sp.]
MREPADGAGEPRELAAESLRVGVLELAAALVIGVLLAAVGPYGTFGQAALPERLIYWVAVVLLAFAIYRPSCALGARAAQALGLPAGSGWCAAVLAMSFPVTLAVWLASYRHTPSLWPSLEEYVGFYGSVILIGAGLMLVIWLVNRAFAPVPKLAGGPPPERMEKAPGASSPRIMNRLPPELRGPVLALQMEDHYVRVQTEAGSTLLLMRMRDAVAETEPMEGSQVHRSWWVSRAAVEKVERDGRRASLVLRNGLRVPISRERRQRLPTWVLGSAEGR